jgi:hypothetical protein
MLKNCVSLAKNRLKNIDNTTQKLDPVIMQKSTDNIFKPMQHLRMRRYIVIHLCVCVRVRV